MTDSRSSIARRLAIWLCAWPLLAGGLGLWLWLRPTSRSLLFWLCWLAAGGGAVLMALAWRLRPGRLLSALNLICVNGLVLAVFLAAGEAACRLAGFDFNRLQQGAADPRAAWPLCFREPDQPFAEAFFKRPGSLTWTGKPLSTAMRLYHATDSAYADEKEFTLALDADGFRNPVPFPDWDVVVAGDSFTESGYLPVEEVYTSIAAAKSGLRVKNLGACHTGPLTQTEYLKAFGAAKSCRDAVLAFFEGNDIRDAERERGELGEFRASGRRPLREVRPQTSLLRALYTAAKSQARFDLRTRFANAVFTAGGKSAPVTIKTPPTPEDPRTMSGEQRQLVSSFLDSWKATAAGMGMKPWLLCIPSNIRAYHGLVRYDDDADDAMKQWQPTALPEMIRKLCEEKGIAFIDGCGPLRVAAESGRLVYNPVFDTHLNAEGSRVLGEALAEALKHGRSVP